MEFSRNSTSSKCPTAPSAVVRPSSLFANASCTRQRPKALFLGGSCNPTTWREDIAIPMLRNLGITYYNPQVTSWKPELVDLENSAKQSADILFFVIDNQTRSVTSMIEVAIYAGSRRKLVLVIHHFDGPGTAIADETVSDSEYHDLHRSQCYLQDLVQRQGIPVFKQIPDALNCIARLLKSDKSPQAEKRPIAEESTFAKLLNDKLTSVVRLVLRAADTAWQSLTTQSSPSSPTASSSSSPLHNASSNNNGALQQLRTPARNSPLHFNYQCQQIFQEAVSRDIYLGGEPDGDWRKSIAIPKLRKHNLSFVSPNEDSYCESLTPDDLSAIENSRLLLFVIGNDCRSVSPMLLAAYFIGLGREVVLCVDYLPDDAVVNGEKLTAQAIKDYNRGRVYLADLATRAGILVYNDVREAIRAAIHKCLIRKQMPLKVRRKRNQKASVDFFKHLTQLSSMVAAQGCTSR
ncbi:hypothetical protein HDE_08059 [Halotydeus destructor]|nr:hypothetical protein HDE_08059 [Halotydeus destructor]